MQLDATVRPFESKARTFQTNDSTCAAAPASLDLLSNPVTLRNLLLGYTEKVLALESAIEAQAPKVAFAEAVGAAEADQKIREVAKALGYGPRKLLAFMKENGILMPDGLPYQHHMDRGRFRVIEVPYNDPTTGTRRIRLQTRVTGKGVTFLQQRLARAGQSEALSGFLHPASPGEHFAMLLE